MKACKRVKVRFMSFVSLLNLYANWLFVVIVERERERGSQKQIVIE